MGVADKASDVPVVVYVAGSGRSGSTLVERVLGGVPGQVNVGELARVFASVARQDQRCGCGSRFSACAFWREVGAEAYGGWSDAHVEHVAALQRRVVRHRRAAQLGGLGGDQAFRAARLEYRETYERLYRAIRVVSGAEVIVDASKSPMQLLALRGSQALDLRVLNVVRDPRGVAFSWSKQGVRKPHDETGNQIMGAFSPRRTALMWSSVQTEAAILARVSRHGVTVRYEDVVDAPARSLADALAGLGLPPADGAFAHVSGRRVDLGPSHGVSGNPSRFTTGQVELQRDEGWSQGMTARDRRLVTALTLPQLLSYRYPVSQR